MAEQKGLSKARNLIENREIYPKRKKQAGLPVIGYLCCFAPPEIIHAAGALPYRLTGKLGDSTAEVEAYLEPYGCPYVRNIFSQSLKGHWDFLDGLVISHSCDMVQRLYGIWTYYKPLAYQRMVNVPHQLFSWSQDFYQRELRFFKESLERFFRREITDKKLKESIALYNRIRQQIRQLYHSRNSHPPGLLSSELMEVLIAGEILTPEDFLQLLQEVNEEVSYRKKNIDCQGRILVWGSILDDPKLYQLIEASGGQVVADDTCLGMRFWNQDVPLTEDPYEGLKNHYLVDFQCPRTDRGTDQERFAYVKEMAKEAGAQGVIAYTIAFCDPHKLDYPDLRDYLEEHGYPMLLIDDDYTLQNEGALSTRIQAFLEMLH